MKLSEFVAEIKTGLKSYDSAGYLDEISIRRWVTDELKRFGTNIMTTFEHTYEVKNGTVVFPDNFWHLKFALKVEPQAYDIVQGDIDILQDTFFWTERIEKTEPWDDWSDLIITDLEKTITETVYLNKQDAIVNFYYNNPHLLTVNEKFNTHFFSKNAFSIDSTIRKNSLYEVTLNNKTMYTNFKEGYVYIHYYGLEVDEEEEIVIPETQHGHLIKYLEYYVKRRVMEDVLVNTADVKSAQILGYYQQQENDMFGLAMTEAKFSTITQGTFQKYRNNNRSQMMKYEEMMPKI